MQSIQTCLSYDLSQVKPLEKVLAYREYCLDRCRRALQEGKDRRQVSPVAPVALVPFGKVGNLEYLSCPETESLFLADLPPQKRWSSLLVEISQYRRNKSFQADLKDSRLTHVYQAKKEWIANTLHMHRFLKPRVLEFTLPPSELTPLLKEDSTFGEIFVLDESQEVPHQNVAGGGADVAILLETLDHAHDPVSLVSDVFQILKKGGLLFLTALVSSGFDFRILGNQNVYLCPPDRANCFSLKGLTQLLTKAGFSLLEVSTPGILDVEIVKAHRFHDPSIRLSAFEETLLNGDAEKLSALQIFLQQSQLSSFARVVAKK